MVENANNPRNQESTLFKKLTRLLSGPIINRRTQGYRSQRRKDLDKYRFTSASGQNFKKSAYNPFESLNSNWMASQRRNERYVDFDQMEYTPELASALDIYADEMTTSTSLEKMLTVKCPNEEIKSVLDTLYTNILNVDFNLFGWCRTMCKYGDFFLYLDIDEHIGIKSVIGLPPPEVERMDGEDPTNPNYIQYQWNSGGLTFENWQVAHFRILGNDKYAPYGTSVLDPARRIWRQLILLEDAMMAYRVVRSPERRVFYIDVGAIAPEDVEQYMQKIITQMKRNQIVDQDTGRVDLRYNPMSIEEDFFLPVRGSQTNTRIENLAGGAYTGDIDDVKYLRDKLFSAIKIPQSYLSSAEEAGEDKTTLAQKDIRFARTIQRLQRAVLSELEKVGIIHLYTLGFRGDDLIAFTLSLNNPSKLAVLQELETWGTKFDTAANATEGYFSKRWVAQNILGMSDEEFLRNQREMFYDRKTQGLLDAAAEMAAEETGASGAMGTELGGEELGGEDLGGEELGGEDLGGEELGGEELGGEEPGGEEPGGEELGGEDETLLAAPPAKRDDNIRQYEKGTYTLAKRDNRSHSAPRKKQYGAEYSKEKSSGTHRSVFPGDLKSLARGIYEENDDSYNVEEEKIFRIKQSHNDVKLLIEQMEKRQDEKREVQE